MIFAHLRELICAHLREPICDHLREYDLRPTARTPSALICENMICAHLREHDLRSSARTPSAPICENPSASAAYLIHKATCRHEFNDRCTKLENPFIYIHPMESIKHGDILEITSDGLLIANASDALDLLGSTYFQGYDKMILHQKNITPDFFDLQNGMAGEILQKFSNYRMRLAIVGDFSDIPKRSLRDFIFESNKGGRINFVATVKEALERLM